MARGRITENIHWHTVNDNRDRNNKKKGPALFHGRWYLHIFRHVLRLTWAFGKHATTTGGNLWCDFVWEKEAGIGFRIKRLFYLGAAIESPSFPSWDYDHGNREIGWAFHNNTLWIDLWRDVDGGDWRKRHVVFDFAKFLFGKQQYSEKKMGDYLEFVQLPEGDYPATVEMVEASWKRPRLPKVTRVRRAHVVPAIPIQVPGKGENSWDCGDDAVYSMTCNADTPAEACQKLAESVLRDRND